MLVFHTDIGKLDFLKAAPQFYKKNLIKITIQALKAHFKTQIHILDNNRQIAY